MMVSIRGTPPPRSLGNGPLLGCELFATRPREQWVNASKCICITTWASNGQVCQPLAQMELPVHRCLPAAPPQPFHKARKVGELWFRYSVRSNIYKKTEIISELSFISGLPPPTHHPTLYWTEKQLTIPFRAKFSRSGTYWLWLSLSYTHMWHSC